MASPFPIENDVQVEADDVEVVDIGAETDGTVLDVLSSETARRILATLKEDPKPASDIAETLDSSIQNVQYHLENLQGAGLVSAVDTWYSETGTEMDVYAPTVGAVVVLTGASRETVATDRLLTGVVTALVALLAVSVWLQLRSAATGQYHVRVVTDAVSAITLEPGLMFFLGGVFALVVYAVGRALAGVAR